MNRFTSEILTLMRKKEHIRNISIVSHVDHGKTTLSDHLLQAGGLISKTMAGKARVLDYLEEEQKRGITIKTANISFIFKNNGERYLINLVDTPGHIDFSAAVSQALRLVDGVVIIVDAVEQIMAQTESVIRQAMQECLRPILFINKVDRLITELKLSKSEIETRITNIIQLTNELIEQYKPKDLKDDWRLRLDKGTVIIGSALHGWGISKYCSPMPKFDNIIEAYNTNQQDVLGEKYPISKSILLSIIENVPNPIEAQKKRIPFIIESIDNYTKQIIYSCNDSSPSISCVGKLLYEDNRGIITVIRVFSGTIKANTKLFNPRANKTYRVNQVCLYKGNKLITIPQLNAGNIGALIGIEDVFISDTLLQEGAKIEGILFKPIEYLQEAVITRRIEPKKISDIPLLTKKLEIFSKTKPNFYYSIDDQTGEIRIYGIGELQLEVIVNEIKQMGIEVELYEPEVTFVEEIEKEVEITKHDPLNRIGIRIRCRRASDSEKDYIAKYRHNNYLIIKIANRTEELTDLIKIGFKNALLKGPKGYPLRNIAIEVLEIIEYKPDSLRYEVIVPTISSAIRQALLRANASVYEPIYKFEITTPPHYLGAVLSVIQKFNGDVEQIIELKTRHCIIGKISVSSSLNIAPELRSASEGFAFWQFRFIGYKKIKG